MFRAGVGLKAGEPLASGLFTGPMRIYYSGIEFIAGEVCYWPGFRRTTCPDLEGALRGEVGLSDSALRFFVYPRPIMGFARLDGER